MAFVAHADQFALALVVGGAAGDTDTSAASLARQTLCVAGTGDLALALGTNLSTLLVLAPNLGAGIRDE